MSLVLGDEFGGDALPVAGSVDSVDMSTAGVVEVTGAPLGLPAGGLPALDFGVLSGPPVAGFPIVGFPVLSIPVHDLSATLPALPLAVDDLPALPLPALPLPALSLPVDDLPLPALPATSMPIEALPPAPMPVESLPVSTLPVSPEMSPQGLAALPVAHLPVPNAPAQVLGPPTQERVGGMYVAAGSLTADQLVNGQPGMFDHLQDRIVDMRDWVQSQLVERGYAEQIGEARTNPELRVEIEAMIDRLILVRTSEKSVVRGDDKAILIASVINEILGLGPIEPLWSDPRITEVMVNGPKEVHAEIDGRLVLVPGAQFRDGAHLLEVCQKILQPLGRRIDLSNPLEDGRLPDGSRTNIVHSAIAPEGPYLTIRRFPETVWTLKDLVEVDSLDQEMATWLAFLINHKCSAIVVGGTGSGKALDVDTPIPTPDGFTRMGDLVVGSVVFDEAGELTTVTGVFDQAPGRDCFEVVFSDGSVIVADGDHLWETTTADGMRAVVSTTDIASSTHTPGHLLNHHVRACGPVQFTEKDLPVGPYIVGAWFGGELAVDDDLPVGLGFAAPGRIPGEYLRGNEKQRRALLCGLLDAGGRISATGSAQFTTPNQDLVSDVQTLVASLGWVCRVRCAPTGPGQGQPASWVATWEDPDEALTMALAWGKPVPGSDGPGCEATAGTPPQHRFITGVRPVQSRPVRCIMVDSSTRLYLAGKSFIPTHNTSLLNALSSTIDRGERIATIEDALELRMHPSAHVLRLEARPPSAGGMAEVTIRALVKNSLRMRPDRVIVGEVRDGAALDMLTAMNTGHEGSMTTVHANGAFEAVRRLEVLVAQGAEGIGAAAVKWLISDAVDLFIVQRRYEDGSRRVSGIYEIPNLTSDKDELVPIPLWEWEQSGVENGKFVGSYVKRADISGSLRERRRLDMFPMTTWADVLRMSEVPAELKRKG